MTKRMVKDISQAQPGVAISARYRKYHEELAVNNMTRLFSGGRAMVGDGREGGWRPPFLDCWVGSLDFNFWEIKGVAIKPAKS